MRQTFVQRFAVFASTSGWFVPLGLIVIMVSMTLAFIALLPERYTPDAAIKACVAEGKIPELLERGSVVCLSPEAHAAIKR